VELKKKGEKIEVKVSPRKKNENNNKKDFAHDILNCYLS